MPVEGYLVCIGCGLDKGGFGPAEVIAGFAAITGLVATYAGIQAFIVADRALRSGILREEFVSHRTKIETNLVTIDRALVGLEQSANPNMPFARLADNFTTAYAEVSRSVSEINEEATKIAARGLFNGKWTETLSPIVRQIELHWDTILDDDIPDGIRRDSARTLVAQLRMLATAARGLIDDTVKAPLAAGLFGIRRKVKL